MFGLSFAELIVIGVVILIVFGPEKLPEIASKLGKMSGELKKTTDSLRREFYNSVYHPSREIETAVKNLTVEPSTPVKPQPQEESKTDEPRTDPK